MRSLVFAIAMCLVASTAVAAPSISYTTLGFDCTGGNRTLSRVSIYDAFAVPTTGPDVPRIYYRKSGGTWYSQPGTHTGSGLWDFTIVAADMGTLGTNDIVQYYVIAQNSASTPAVASSPAGVAATNVSNVTAHPTLPNSYTVAPSLSGTFTVGTGGDYATLPAAINAYNNACITGPVVFNLTDATYNVTSVLTINNPTAGATGVLTIKPATGATVAITASNSTNIFSIRTGFVTIDGNNGTADRKLTIANTGSGSGVVLGVFSSMDTVRNITIQNAVIANNLNNSRALHFSDASSLNSLGIFKNIIIRNNAIKKAFTGIGIYAYSTAVGIEISGNDLSASGTDAIRNRGIYIEGTSGAVISKNTIGNFSGSEDENDVGILLGAGARTAVVEGNRVFSLRYTGTGGWGAQGIHISSGVLGANIRVANNFIADIGGDGYSMAAYTANPIGILLSSGQSGVEVVHNSIHLYGATLNQTQAQAMGIYLASGSSARVVNNLIVNNIEFKSGAPTGSVAPLGAIGICAAGSGQFTAISNNNYWVAPSGLGVKEIGLIGGTGYTTLAAWQAASGETGATNVQPSFVSSTDLHLTATGNSGLDNTGTATTVSTDIDNEARSATTPDVGADEFGAVCSAPAITAQPVAVAVCPGGNATFSVTATGTGLSYQWRKGGVAINGATAASYTINPVADAGMYDVVVTGTCGTVTSTGAALSLNAAPAITTQPVGVTVCNGASFTLSVAATGTALTYQWKKDGVDISGATAATYSGTASTTAAGSYSVTVSGACAPPVTSVAASVSLTQAPIFTTQPSVQTVCAGMAATFSAAATGTGVNYQ